MNVGLVFPNQLFQSHPILIQPLDKILLVEDSLFFGDYEYPLKFCKHKLVYLRTCMRRFKIRLQEQGHKVDYIQYRHKKNILQHVFSQLDDGCEHTIFTLNPVDYELNKRINKYCLQFNYKLVMHDNPGFLNDVITNNKWIENQKRLRMSEFYKHQRIRLGILMKDDAPEGGKWSFDAENRRKIPKKEISQIPELSKSFNDKIVRASIKSINKEFNGEEVRLDSFSYPSSHQQALQWLRLFLKERLKKFGDYEDAIVENQTWLYHSVLTPMLNVGLITPQVIIDETINYAKKESIPLNSLEGFIRQIIGWREFMRVSYEQIGTTARNSNYWRHDRSMPDAFYTGDTNIYPVDCVIQRVLTTGYCHHIERLMVLGGFMFLCEIHPNEIYNWFMEMFVDSYDWVMVPNVYSMSQHADGGLITTKPYFSGSNYISKMSNFKKGEWCKVWDGLFWRWIDKNKSNLKKNSRWAIICKRASEMDESKLKAHIYVAEGYLESLN